MISKVGLIGIVFLISLSLCQAAVLSAQEAQDLLQKARQHLQQPDKESSGILLMQQAVQDLPESDPEAYLVRFKRAVLWLSLGRQHAALEDFNWVLEKRPGFDQAILQRAKVYLRLCELDEAEKDLKQLADNKEGSALLAEVQTTQALLKQVQSSSFVPEDATSFLSKKSKATKLPSESDYQGIVEKLSTVLQVCSHDPEARMLRAYVYEQGYSDPSHNKKVNHRDIHLSMADYTRAISLFPPSQTIPLLLHLTHLHIRHSEQSDLAIGVLKQCLHSDPEHKECGRLFKLVKRFQKAITKTEELMGRGRFLDAASGNRDALNVEKVETGKQAKGAWNVARELGLTENGADGIAKPVLRMACECFTKLKSHEKTVNWCSKALDEEPDNVDLLCNRADGYVGKEEYDAAMRDYQKAQELSGGQPSQRIREGLHRIQNLQRMASRKDYYKVLGVPRDSTPAQIKKAYRKLAIKYHPDKYQGSKDEAEKKMSELNQAYEVLSNEELRNRFDQGEDPNDPQSHANPFGGGGGFHGNPFGGFGHGGPIFFQQGGGGGHGFKFHFG